MQVCGTIPLCARADLPGQWEGAPFVDHAHHQCHTPTAHDTAIQHEHERVHGPMGKEHLRIGDTGDLGGDLVVAHPPCQACATPLWLGAIRHVGRDVGSWRTLAPDHVADQCSEGHPVPGDSAGWLARITLCEGVLYGTIPAEVVAHRPLLLVGSRFPGEYTMSQPLKH